MSKKTSSRKRPKKRGSLTIVALFLFASAAIRIGTEAGQAIARESQSPEIIEEIDEASTSGQICENREDLRTMLNLFSVRDEKLSAREDEMQMRAKALAIAEEQINWKLEELRLAEKGLRDTIALASDAAEGDLARLTEVYETMKPKDAAALFEEMDPEFAAGFLGRMRPDSAAGVMAGLSPQTAYTVSVVLAGRNAMTPTE